MSENICVGFIIKEKASLELKAINIYDAENIKISRKFPLRVG